MDDNYLIRFEIKNTICTALGKRLGHLGPEILGPTCLRSRVSSYPCDM